jgi:NADP-dependent 3-hydroxy acid dehydrogenase YdfG
MSNNIQGKVAVITGASSGLGEATARHLGNLGATVVLGARRADRIETLAAELSKQGVKALAVTTDVTRAEQVKQLVDAAMTAFGHVDVMLNNAGLMPSSPTRTSEGRRLGPDGRRELEGGPLRHRRRAADHEDAEIRPCHQRLLRRGPQGTRWRRRLRSDQARLRALTEGLHQEVKPFNIRTTVISPGAVATELPQSVTEADVAERFHLFYEQVAIPAESFARAVAYAMSQP